MKIYIESFLYDLLQFVIGYYYGCINIIYNFDLLTFSCW